MDKELDKAAVRKALIEQRLSLPDRGQRIERLQQIMRIWLIGRPDTVIGAYWPIKGEFDPLPALYRWQEDATLGAVSGGISNTLSAIFSGQAKSDKPVDEAVAAAQLANESIASRSPHKIGLPVINRVHKTLTFHAWYPGCPMQEDAYNIPKPKDTELLVPTLLFVPCLGYGPNGYRLGYGGGFYDRTLASLQPKPFTVGLGFAHGWVPDFRPEPHDVPLDAILTDEGVVFSQR